MRRDSRLSTALHALLHLAETDDVVTSEELAERMEIHPVVMRRTMAGLRDVGIVKSEKGHGGGWALARTLDAVTLGDVYDALGITTLFALGVRTESPGCLVEQAVNEAVGRAFADAEAALFERLRRVKLSDVEADVKRRNASRKLFSRKAASGERAPSGASSGRSGSSRAKTCRA